MNVWIIYNAPALCEIISTMLFFAKHYGFLSQQKKTLLSLVISLPAKYGTSGFVVSQGAQFHIMKNYLKSNAINIFLLTKVLIKNQDTSIQSLPIFSILPLII